MAADDLHRDNPIQHHDDPLQILWEDSAAMVVNKPSGLLTQGAAGVPSLETILRAQVASKCEANSPYLAFAHRIDRPVSGALLIAKNVRAARRFGAQFQSRKIGKCYLAIVVAHSNRRRIPGSIGCENCQRGRLLKSSMHRIRTPSEPYCTIRRSRQALTNSETR